MDYRPHRKLDVWKKSMMLAKEIYNVTDKFPKSEIYGLTSQLRRAAVSVPNNLAEGAARRGNREFRQFINIAQGSLSELDTQIDLAYMLGYLETISHKKLMGKITDISKSKMLFGLSKSVGNENV